MDAQEARYQRELSTYRDRVQENIGKPIEGTGAIQVGYFTHLLILAAILAVAWMIVRTIAIFNAPVAVGLKTVERGSRFLGRALAEVVEAVRTSKPASASASPISPTSPNPSSTTSATPTAPAKAGMSSEQWWG